MPVSEIRSRIVVMSSRVYEMLELIQKAFMENKSEVLSQAMKKEAEINEFEKTLTATILELSKSVKDMKDRKTLIALEQVVESLERMGDEAANIVERIEIKVAEQLRFSELGVVQFNETFDTMKKSVELMREFLKGKDSGTKERIIDNGFHVKELVERYRHEHADRLLAGICTPMAANMFFDMIDFTGNLARHASNIVKLF